MGFCVAVQQRKAMREASESRTVTDTDSYAFFIITFNRQREDDRGIRNDMCKTLRKVTFSLGRYEFHPDPTPKEEAEMEELSKERKGYFHRWVEDVDTSKDIPYLRPLALVEDIEDGSMHTVEYYNLRFSEE